MQRLALRFFSGSLLALLIASSGCDCAGPDRRVGEGGACDATIDCEEGLQCIDGTCQRSPDGGFPDGGIPGDVPGLDAPGADVPSSCAPACTIGQRCDETGAPTCIDNTCADLACDATSRCEPAPSGTGNVCVNNTCTDSVDCPESRYCDGTLCVTDACVPGEATCSSGGGVSVCGSDGAPSVVRYTCGSDAYFTSMCTVDGTTAYCPCEDDWDCPAFTVCEAGRCEGTGTAPTCRLPAAPFSEALPTVEAGFPWGGPSRTDPNADPMATPYANSTQVVMTPVVANLDDDNGDGRIDERDYPEIVFLSFCGSSYTVDGVLRAVHGGGPARGGDFFATCGSAVWHEGDALPVNCGCTGGGDLNSTAGIAVGDIDGDGVPEIVVPSDTNRLRIYSNTGVQLLDLGGTAITPNGSPSIANVDGVGFAEVILGAHVFTFEHDGAGALALLDRFDGALGQGINNQGPISCVANIAGGGELEIIGGSTAYRLPTPPAGVTRRSGCPGGDTSDFCAGRLAVVWDARTVSTSVASREGYCAVADVLGADRTAAPGPANPPDGAPEVIVMFGGALQIFAGDTGVRYRDITITGTSRGGAPNVDDFDGDGFAEIGLAGSTNYVMLDLQPASPACPAWPTVMVDGAASTNPVRNPPGAACSSDAECGDVTQFACNEAIGACVCLHNGWTRRTEDDSSQVTGSSVFDFNGDGGAEVVYNDECYFRVYNGLDGAVLFREPSESRTRTENPVIADVDNDGNAEIVFATSTESGFCSDTSLRPMFNPGIEVWGDTSDLWVSARRIWNEHAYHVTNVLESGGIPVREPESWRDYGGREYNTYRSQPRSFGTAPNLQVVRIQVSSPDAACGTLGSRLSIAIRIRNAGDVRVGADIPVALFGEWDAGPTMEPLYADGAMTPLVVTLGRTLEAGASLILTVPYDSSTSTLGTLPDRIRVVVDPPSTGAPLGVERECIETDNEQSIVVEGGALVADLEVELTGPTGECPVLTFGATVTNRGSTEASALVVRFYAGDPSTGGRLLGEETIAGPLAPGASASVTSPLEILGTGIQIFVVVDPDDTVLECNDGNNVDASTDRYGCLL
jgi:hypothetical protein